QLLDGGGARIRPGGFRVEGAGGGAQGQAHRFQGGVHRESFLRTGTSWAPRGRRPGVGGGTQPLSVQLGVQAVSQVLPHPSLVIDHSGSPCCGTWTRRSRSNRSPAGWRSRLTGTMPSGVSETVSVLTGCSFLSLSKR